MWLLNYCKCQLDDFLYKWDCLGHNKLKRSFIPRSSATSWAHWAVVSGHKPPSSSLLWRDQRAPDHSREAGNLHECLRRWSKRELV